MRDESEAISPGISELVGRSMEIEISGAKIGCMETRRWN